MSDQDSKPATSATGFPFTAQDALEFMQKLWNPLGVPLPGFPASGAGNSSNAAAPATAAKPGLTSFAGLPFPSPATMFAALDPAEIDRKIGELKVIENWLAMSIGMVQMSAKTLELQKASLEALRGAASTSASLMRSGTRNGKE